MKKAFPILYKYTSKGQVQQWQIFAEGDRFWTEEGIQGGKLTTSLPTICKGKNIGRSNETSSEQQAEKEAQAKWQKKVDGGYNETLTAEKKFFEPMLAHELSKYEKLLFTVPTFIQPKLDGLRAISEDNTLMSRNGKPYLACPHLYQSDVILDGELYSHEYKDDFNKIVSLCKKQKPTQEELDESAEKVEFWAYDFPSHKGPFSHRYAALKRWIAKEEGKWDTCPFKLVPTYEVKSQKDVDKYHEKFLEEGYEGSILRLDLGEYENKRSKQLLKKKDFVDEEFVIVDVEEGVGVRTGTVGRFTMEMKDGRQFGSNIKGEFTYLADLLKNKKKLIGKRATVKYFNLTPDGIPRFPYVIKIDRDEYE